MDIDLLITLCAYLCTYTCTHINKSITHNKWSDMCTCVCTWI